MPWSLVMCIAENILQAFIEKHKPLNDAEDLKHVLVDVFGCVLFVKGFSNRTVAVQHE